MNENSEITLVVTAVAALIGSVLSMVFTFFPHLNTWFAAQPAGFKQAVMSIAGLVVSLLIVVVKNYGSGADIWALGLQVILAWLAYTNTNQSTDRIMPKPQAVKDAKAG